MNEPVTMGVFIAYVLGTAFGTVLGNVMLMLSDVLARRGMTKWRRRSLIGVLGAIGILMTIPVGMALT
ncbi:hypothetical protein [Massilia sp. TSP1-1-2]|uniref:hypothetical protein n=1 Tax=Massilia sp. TSP1-1-2 TaxID=2804649 RepID=UPI003CF16F48